LLPDNLILNLEDASDFISESLVYTAAEMIIMCEPMLEYWNTKRFSPEVLALHVKEDEFVLY
jgi:hypothetical protein